MAPAPALVLLPGMDGSGDLFAAFVAALGDADTPLVVSYPASQALGYEELVVFARVRLPAGKPWVLLGESFSGPVAIALAAEQPPGLCALILSCTFARNPVPLLRPFSSLLRFFPVSSRLTVLSLPLLLGRYSRPDLHRSLRSALDKVAAPVLRARMRAVLGVDVSEKLTSITMPVFYLQGTQDRVVGRASARHIASLLPSVKVIELCGPHLLLQAAPLETAALVAQLVNKAVMSETAGRT